VYWRDASVCRVVSASSLNSATGKTHNKGGGIWRLTCVPIRLYLLNAMDENHILKP